MALNIRGLNDYVKCLGNQDIQLDCTDGSQSCLINIRGNTEFFIAKNVCNTVK